MFNLDALNEKYYKNYYIVYQYVFSMVLKG